MAEFYQPLPASLFRYGGGAADHARRAIGNWWSDHAADLMAPGGTPVVAVEDLAVSSVTRRPSTGTGVNDGSTVFARGASGEEYAFLHLDPARLPAVGQRLKAGQPFARIAAGTAGGPHLHFATRSADPTEFVKRAGSGDKGGLRDWLASANPLAPVGPDNDSDDGPAGVLNPVWGGIKSVPEFLQAITNPHNILRGLQIAAGAVLVLAGVVLLARQVALAADLPDPVTAAAGVATRGAV